MMKKSLLVISMLILTNCAGTIKVAEESTKDSATPLKTKESVTKPKN